MNIVFKKNHIKSLFVGLTIVLLLTSNFAFSSEHSVHYIKKRAAFIQLLEHDVVPYVKKTRKHHPTCFISYAWGILSYERWVREFAEILRSSGVIVYFDRWEDKKGKEIFDFIKKMENADYVLVIGTKLYLKKYNKRATLKTEREHFVSFEASMIDYILSRSIKSNKKIIPIIIEGTSETSLPFFLRAKVPCDFVQNDYFEELLMLIRDLWGIDNQDQHFNELIEKFKYTSEIIDSHEESVFCSQECKKIWKENKTLKLQIEKLKSKLAKVVDKK